ncbi:MAG: KR domain-containing protein [Bacteriovoracaceae bacterium]|jgi:[acyl-carrier-protein] S-malonyltransferase|nr:KR domain-containing protein [Bacteriovoracaceae bacterium]
MVTDNLKMSFHSFFKGHYSISYDSKLPMDFSKKVLLFAGQGSANLQDFTQSYKNYPTVKEFVKRADLFLKKEYSLSVENYIKGNVFYNPSMNSKLHSLSLVIIQCAKFNYLQSIGFKINLVTAFSFGEYAALFSIGCISFDDIIKIVAKREMLCPPPNKIGYMIMLRGKPEDLPEELNKIKFYISNKNTNDHFVLSCGPLEKDQIINQLNGTNFSPYLLDNVHQPYHSPLMEDVSYNFLDYLKKENFQFKEPIIPYFSGVTKEIIDRDNFNPKKILALLANQIVTPVDFPNQINSIAKNKTYTFLEVGPGQFCTSCVKRILNDNNYKILKIDKLDGLISHKVSNPKEISTSVFFKPIKYIIERVTGHKVSEVEFNKSFQNDFGIDSLKKAEIVFEVIKESEKNMNVKFNNEINLVDLEVINDLVNLLEDESQSQSELSKKSVPIDMHPEIDFYNYPEQLIQFTLDIRKTYKHEIYLITSNEILSSENKVKTKIYQSLNGHINNGSWIIFDISNLIHLELSPLTNFKQTVISIILFWQKTLIENKDRSLKICLKFINSFEEMNPLFNAFSSFFKSIQLENSQFRFKGIQSSSALGQDELYQLLSTPFDNSIYKLQGKYFKIGFSKDTTEKTQVNLSKVPCIVIIGGAGGISQSLLLDQPFPVESQIFLLGRRHSNDKNIKDIILRLKSYYNHLTYLQVDACNHMALRDNLKKVQGDKNNIDLLINSAGIEYSKNFIYKNSDEIIKELDSKCIISLNIKNLTDEIKINNIFTFSSITGVFGNKGQSIYAFSNGFINALSQSSSNTVNSKVIHWPAWEDTGMTALPGNKLALLDRHFHLMPKYIGNKFFRDILSTKTPLSNLIISAQDLSMFQLHQFNYKSIRPFIGSEKISNDLSFSLNFSIRSHVFLQDHIYNGICLVPGAYMISMFLTIAFLHDIELVQINNFKIYNPLIIKGDQNKVQLMIKIENQKMFDAKLINQSNISACKLTSLVDYTENKWWSEDHDFDEITPKVIYDDNLFHGKKFQTINNIHLKKNQLKTSIIIADLLPLTGVQKLDNYTLYIDTIFQLINLHPNSKSLKLPNSVSKLLIFPDIINSIKLTIYCEIEREDKFETLARAVILNELNQTCMLLDGIILKNIT